MQGVWQSVMVDGVRVRVFKAGSGPALLLVHGLVGSARNWDRNLESLSKLRTVYAIDQVNMGESDRVAGLDASLEATADRLARLMDELSLARADVGGHSHGGAISMMLAARHPGRVRKLVLFAPANPYCELGRGLISFYTSRAGTLFARAIPHLPRAVHGFAHRRMYGDPRSAPAEMLDGYTRGLNRESVEHVLSIVRLWWSDMARLREQLRTLADLPVLLIWGDRDGAVGVGSGRLLAERLGAPLMVLPGVGHLPFVERPELCNEAVGEWLLA